MYGWWLLSRGGGAANFQGGASDPTAPYPLNETLMMIISIIELTLPVGTFMDFNFSEHRRNLIMGSSNEAVTEPIYSTC